MYVFTPLSDIVYRLFVYTTEKYMRHPDYQYQWKQIVNNNQMLHNGIIIKRTFKLNLFDIRFVY